MGTIAQVDQKPGERYNKINVYEAEGNVAVGGWGVRERDQSVGIEGDSVICRSHTLNPNSLVQYVSFRVLDVSGTPDTDYVVLSIWKKASISLSFAKVSRFVIDKTVLEANYGTGITFVAGTQYTVLIDNPVFLEAISGVEYYVSIYSDGCGLDYDDDGTVNGAYLKTGVDISDGNDIYDISSLASCDYAVSFEAFSEPDGWIKLQDGGSISDKNEDWKDPHFCTSPAWPNPDRIYDGTSATADSITAGDEILIDIGAGLVPSIPWPGAGLSSALSNNSTFPDYGAYGVRALHEIIISAVVSSAGDPGTLDIMISAEDSDIAPSFGYERIASLDPATYAPYRLKIPSIARWVRIVHAGGSDSIAISNIEIYQIQHAISDGNFPVDVVRASHVVWVENYPIDIAIRKLTMGNMAGGESIPGKPFTNREQLD